MRNYYLRERSAQTDPDIAVRLDIEPLDEPGPPPPLDDATFAASPPRRERLLARDDDRDARLR